MAEADHRFDCLLLDHQLCFPLYACSKEIIRRYKPMLDELDLTYTQYIVMLVLWERRSVTAKELGSCLYLDSGTLTPLLKKLEAKGLLTRRRSEQDERSLVLSITQQGMDLRAQAEHIPQAMGKCVELEGAEKETLLRLLRKMMDGIER
jgi:DNA-binding MarR family transcriptional regulator